MNLSRDEGKICVSEKMHVYCGCSAYEKLPSHGGEPDGSGRDVIAGVHVGSNGEGGEPLHGRGFGRVMNGVIKMYAVLFSEQINT